MTASTEFDKWELAAQEAIELLENTFEGDPKRSHLPGLVRDSYRQMLASGTPIAYRLAAMYAQWCAMNPGSIEERPFKSCSCTGGFVLIPKIGQYRPCDSCLPKSFESWQKESGYGYDGEI